MSKCTPGKCSQSLTWQDRFYQGCHSIHQMSRVHKPYYTAVRLRVSRQLLQRPLADTGEGTGDSHVPSAEPGEVLVDGDLLHIDCAVLVNRESILGIRLGSSRTVCRKATILCEGLYQKPCTCMQHIVTSEVQPPIPIWHNTKAGLQQMPGVIQAFQMKHGTQDCGSGELQLYAKMIWRKPNRHKPSPGINVCMQH